MGKKILSSFICLLLMASFVPTTVAESFVPQEYYANYHIAEDWSRLLNLNIDLKAANKVGADVDIKVFNELHDIYKKVFEFFPSDPASELIYRKCLLTTEDIKAKNEVTRNDYTVFREQCFNPIGGLLKKIQNEYTVEPDIIVKPNQGSAPLNVTLDARGSIDPSNDTIPSSNFYRWYKDVHGNEQPIGKDPVVNYTFTEPGNHIVHLTVRSSNNLTQGVFDGSDNISVNVAPKSADIIIYTNGKQLTTDDTVRIGTQDAQDGILIDGTSTRPTGARTILEYLWTIKSAELQYEFKKSGEGNPGQFVHQFPRNGVYQIELELIDNENNKITEKYALSVSDPVASVKFQPEEGTTSDTFTFDASTSYSLTSRVKTYQREITDPEGEKIDILETKKMKRKFSRPGPYTVKLTVTDELGHSSYDTEQFYVASTAPVPSFTVKSSTDLEYPSQFYLDASPSFDEDILNGNDLLSYYWSFAPSEQINILSQDDQDKRILVTYNLPGTYTAKLRVEDAYGEIAEIEKEIKVESTLRPKLHVNPLVAQREDMMTFTASFSEGDNDKKIDFYEWDLGDGKKQNSNEPSITHTFKEAGVYEVTLKVVAGDEENTVREQVFMGQKDMPVVSYQVKGRQGEKLQPTGTCAGLSGANELAYEVDRYETFMLDASDSRDTQGKKTDIVINVHPQNDEVYPKTNLNYDFLEVGCTYIDIFADDTNAGKSDKKRVWFDVKNALPTLSNLILEFPQPGGGGNMGVGSATQVTTNREIFNDASVDPIVIKVQAKGARDGDGFISHYAWYYYESANPDNIIALKITPADVPYTSFIVPKPHNPTEYAFVVRMVDNDGGEVTSEDVLGKGPIVFFPPGENSLDVPIVTMKANVYQTKVGEEVTFTTDARILSQKPDFESSRYFKYDFDGDGQYDLTSKQSVVSHRYEKSGDVKPKVAVYYRGRAGIGIADNLIVQKGLKPILLYDSFGTKIVVKDVSIGDIEESTLCMDIRECRSNKDWIFKNQEIADFSYESPGSYFLQFDVIDAFGNNQTIREKIAISDAQGLGILSLPKSITNSDGNTEISVGSNLDNEIVLHVVYEAGNCYGDVNIAQDADNDGDPTNDDDFNCNSSEVLAFRPTDKSQVARIHYVDKGEKQEKDITISFIDFEEVIPEEYMRAVEEIASILSSLSEEEDEVLSFYKDLLLNLKSSLGETDEMNSLLIQLRDVLAERPDLLTTNQRDRVMNLINSLSDDTVKQIFGGSEYDTARSNILAWFGDDVAEEIGLLFAQFEEADNKEQRKNILDEVFKITGREKQAGTIDPVDFAYVQKNLCDIIVYYELPSKTCGTALEVEEGVEVTSGDDTESLTESSSSGGTSKKILRIVVIVVIVLAIIFGILVLLFAIKARRQKAYDDEYDDEDDDEDDHDLDVHEESHDEPSVEADESEEE